MIDKAYVQRKNGEWLNENAFSVVTGLRLMGIEVIGFDFKELEHLELTPTTLVHGGIYTVKRALERLQVAPPTECGGLPPAELLPFYGRKVWAATMGDVRRRLNEDDHVFIKPLHSQKAFTGHVTSGELRELIQTAGFDDDFEVLCSEPVTFISEYRCFINRGKLVGMRHYKGDFTRIVCADVVRQAIAAWQGPVSYALDFGLVSTGEPVQGEDDTWCKTLLVEANDGFALGAYGLPPLQYANFVIDRWEQMVNKSPS